MSMANIEKITVIQAYLDGATIEHRFKLGADGKVSEWHKANPIYQDFDFRHYDYRVKPEPPKARTFVIKTCAGHRCATVELSGPAQVDELIRVQEFAE